MNRSDGRFGGRLPELMAVVAVVVPGLMLTAVAGLLVAILGAALAGSGLASTAFALVVGTGLVGTLLLATITWLAVGRTRRTVRPRVDDARVSWFQRARRLESLVPPARSAGLADRLEPDEETVVATLQRRYVSGDLDEHEFERELERLLGDGREDGQGDRREDGRGIAGPVPDRVDPPTATDRHGDRGIERELDG